MPFKQHLIRCAIACFSTLAAQGQTLRHAEILGRPTDHSVTVQAFFDDPAEVCVQYGLSSGDYPNQTPWQSVPAGEPAEILIQGLNANTRYYYRLCHRVPGTRKTTEGGLDISRNGGRGRHPASSPSPFISREPFFLP